MYHPVLSFMVGSIIGLLQLKFQGNQAATTTDHTSPFSTHPVTMLLGLLCLFLYFLAALAASTTANSSAAAANSAEIVAATSSTWSLWMSSLLGKISYSASRLLADIKCYTEPLMLIFASMAISTFGSILFPNSAQYYVLCSLYALVGFTAMSLWPWPRNGEVGLDRLPV